MVREDRTLDFKYDHNGMRIQKVLQHDWYPETTNYTYHGKLLTHMTVDYHDWDEAAQQDKLHFFYDAQSRPVKISYNGVIYTYVHNLQGDIVGILDSTGALVVEYKYDAWGKLLSTTGSLADTLGKRNPFRYRGYVYDEESELYYLRSRYYNTVIGRFVNADCTCGVAGRLISHSAFTYCSNAPVDQADDSGKAGNMVSKMPNTVAEAVMRTIINAICGRKHASNLGKFSVKSVTRNITITKESADKHNSLVEGVVGSIAFIHGAILGTYIGQGPKVIEKIAKSTLGGIATDAVSAAIQDVFIDAFTVRPGTYTSILCQYERNFKVLFFLPGVEVHTYELRIYPDYCEVWYSYLYSGFGTTITPSEKVGEMTLFELKEALGGQ